MPAEQAARCPAPAKWGCRSFQRSAMPGRQLVAAGVQLPGTDHWRVPSCAGEVRLPRRLAVIWSASSLYTISPRLVEECLVQVSCVACPIAEACACTGRVAGVVETVSSRVITQLYLACPGRCSRRGSPGYCCCGPAAPRVDQQMQRMAPKPVASSRRASRTEVRRREWHQLRAQPSA